MAPLYVLHPENPQPRRVEAIARDLQRGMVMLYPTDTVYAIGCDLYAKAAVQRVRQIKQLSNDKPLTFLCSSLSQVAQYAQIADRAYRVLRSLVPGPYTMLLPATREVPSWLTPAKVRTIGVRVPDHALCQALIAALGNPLLSTSAHWECGQERRSGALGREQPVDLFGQLEPLVDGILTVEDQYPRILGAGADYPCSTILDFTQDPPRVVRRGLGWDAIAAWGWDDEDESAWETGDRRSLVGSAS